MPIELFLCLGSLAFLQHTAHIRAESEALEDSHLRVLFYNVENLFHPSDDPSRASDDPYTPEGEHGWNDHRYQKKLSGIFKILAAIGKGQTPTIMGFAELEERRVLEDLLQTTPLDERKLCILHYPSPDHRGMDVGMIYRRDRFQPVFVECYRIGLEERGASPTREVLYVKGKASQGTLHLFVTHWPSRYGGRRRTEWKRVRAARVLKEKLDSIEAKDEGSAILIMGDLNDTPIDRSIREVLNAGRLWERSEDSPYYDLMAGLSKGSYFHQGNWSFLDHFIVPARMTRKDSGAPYQATRPEVHDLPWLMKERRGEGKEEMIPHRCFSGPAYIGGISDHLPISVRLMPSLE